MDDVIMEYFHPSNRLSREEQERALSGGPKEEIAAMDKNRIFNETEEADPQPLTTSGRWAETLSYPGCLTTNLLMPGMARIILAACVLLCCLLVPTEAPAFDLGQMFKDAAKSIQQHITGKTEEKAEEGEKQVEKTIDQNLDQSQHAPPATSAEQKATNLKVQQQLNALGYDAGAPDGILGPRSVKAIKAFQRDHGLPETGQVSSELLAALQTASSKPVATETAAPAAVPAQTGQFQPTSVTGLKPVTPAPYLQDAKEQAEYSEPTIVATAMGPWSLNPESRQIFAFSPNGRRVALVATKGSRQMVIIDGIEGPSFSKIMNSVGRLQTGGDNLPLFSPDSSSVTYIGERGGAQFVVTDGREGLGYNRILKLGYSPVGNHLAYVAESKGQQMLVLDGEPRPALAGLSAIDQIQFSDDGRHFAYVASRNKKWIAVVDGEPGPPHNGLIQWLRFSPEGGSYAYVVEEIIGKFQVVLNGRPGPTYYRIGSRAGIAGPANPLLFSERGGHFAYIAYKTGPTHGSQESFLVLDGREVHAHPAASPGVMGADIIHAALSPDGSRWAYVTKDFSESGGRAYIYYNGGKSLDYDGCDTLFFSPNGEQLVAVMVNAGKRIVVVNNTEYGPYDKVDVNSLRFSPDGKRLAFVASVNYRFFVVLDGQPGPKFRVVYDDSLNFSPDGRHVTYNAGGDTSANLAVIDHQAQGVSAVLSPDGTRIAGVEAENVGSSSMKSRVHLDGQPIGQTYSSIERLQFSPDGRHVAAAGTYYGTSGQPGTHLMVDGQEGTVYNAITRIAFSPDSKHVAYAARKDRKSLVAIDGQPLAEYDKVATEIYGAPPGVFGFRDNGTLEFFAVRGGILYRANFNSAYLSRLPSIGRAASVEPGYRRVHKFTDGGRLGNLVAAPDRAFYGTADSGGKYGRGFVFRIDADGSNYRVLYDFAGGQADGVYANSLIIGHDGMLYGTLRTEGRYDMGSIYHLRTDGTDFTVLRHFSPKDGISGKIVSIDSNGTIFLANSGSLCSMKSDGSNSKIIFTPPINRYAKIDFKPEPLGPMVDGGDGFFYGVARNVRSEGTRWLNGIFKIKKDGTAYTVLHEFEGPPHDAAYGDQAPVLGRDGLLYGIGANIGGRNIYKLRRDGSSYQLIFNPTGMNKFGNDLLYGADGQLYIFAGRDYQISLLGINTNGSGQTVIEKFKDPVQVGLIQSLLVHNGDIFGFQQNQMFRYVLPSPTGDNVTVTIREVIRQR